MKKTTIICDECKKEIVERATYYRLIDLIIEEVTSSIKTIKKNHIDFCSTSCCIKYISNLMGEE